MGKGRCPYLLRVERVPSRALTPHRGTANISHRKHAMKSKRLGLVLGAFLALLSLPSYSAHGEMGVGNPASFGSYSAPTGVATIVWALGPGPIPFPAGCTHLT